MTGRGAIARCQRQAGPSRVVFVAVAGALALAACHPVDPRAPATADLLPTRVRRLSNTEYQRTVEYLLGIDVDVHDALPPDERQDGYSVNEAQALTPAHATRLQSAARRWTRAALNRRRRELLGCRLASERGDDACVRGFLRRFAGRAFRRTPTADELSGLRRLVDEGGLELAIATTLQAPSVLYLTELGPRHERRPPRGTTVRLTDHEIAANLAYTVHGGPPDDRLLARARTGDLRHAAAREAEARRLLGKADARHHYRQFILEWLEVDALERTAKAAFVVPDYEAVKGAMLEETRAFVDEAMVHGNASLRSLLVPHFTSLNGTMARYYGVPGFTGPRVTLARQRRVGVLQHASFLAAHAHEDASSPVLRGDFVLRRVLCVDVPRPGELGIETVMPPRTTATTTRERFASHTQRAGCKTCHDSIDPIGFSFEEFDAAGRRRRHEHGRPVRTAGTVKALGVTYRFRDSADLVTQLAARPEARRCFARHAYRYLSGRSVPREESRFAAMVARLPKHRRDNLLEAVVAWIREPGFVFRRQD